MLEYLGQMVQSSVKWTQVLVEMKGIDDPVLIGIIDGGA